MVAATDRADSAPPAELLSVRPVMSPVLFPPGHAGFGAGEEQGAGPGPAAFLHALRRQWLVGSLIGLCLAAAVAVPVSFLLPSSYTSTAYLRVASKTAPLLFETKDRSGVADFKTDMATQQQLMLTPFVLSGALTDGEVAKLPKVRGQLNPVEWLQKEMKVTSEAEIMKVSLSDSDPRTPKLVIDSVVESFLRESEDKEEARRRARLASLEGLQVKFEEILRGKMNELRRFADAAEVSDTESLTPAQQAAVQQWGLLQSELVRVRFELNKARAELDARKNLSSEPAVAGEVASVDLDRAAEADPATARIKQEIERIRGSIADVRRRLAPDAAAALVEKQEVRLSDAERRLAERREGLKGLMERQAPAAVAASSLPVDIKVLEAQEARLAADVDARAAEVNSFKRPPIAIEMMRTEIASFAGVLSQMKQEIEHTKIELENAKNAKAETGESRIQRLGEATSPVAGDMKKRAAMTGFGALAGLCLPIALLVWRDATRRRVDGADTVTATLRLDVLGVVPRVPRRTMRRLAGPSSAAGRWRDRLSEAINAVAAMVVHKAMVEEKRVIVVSSAVAGEGKTTLAGQLAARLGELGHRTLLIDFDLRRPTLHEAFDVSLGPGMSDLLDHAADLEDIVQTTERPNLSLITAGTREPNVLRATSKGLLTEFFAAVRADYEFVIVDSSPVLPVVDTRLIAQFGDGVILSLLKDVSEAPKVSAAIAQLNSYGVSVFGTVLTGCSQDVYYGSRRLAAAV